MPTYYAAGVSVRLSTTATSESLTRVPLGGIGSDVRAESERAEAAIFSGEVLREGRIAAEGAFNADLDFLGKHREVPFYCVGVSVESLTEEEIQDGSKASKGSSGSTKIKLRSWSEKTLNDNGSRSTSQQNTAGGVPRAIEDPDAPPKPRTISLSVQLHKDLSFRRTYEPSCKSDLKIEVYFNGQFANSAFIPGRSIGEKELNLYFSGRRIDRVIEAAWLVFPPLAKYASPSAHDEQRTRVEHAEVEKRWSAISAAIRCEADALGVDAQGHRPPSGEYLETLASLKKPSAMNGVQRLDTRKFGIIDVIITMGKGKKYPTSEGYSRYPERMTDAGFPAADPANDASASVNTMGNVSFEEMYSRWACRTPSSPSHEDQLVENFASTTLGTPIKSPTAGSMKSSVGEDHLTQSRLKFPAPSQKTGIGFLDSARRSIPKAALDITTYGSGPMETMKPYASVSQSVAATGKLLCSPSVPAALRQGSLDATGLSPSFKVLSVLSVSPLKNSDAPLLSPSPGVISRFAMSAPPGVSSYHTLNVQRFDPKTSPSHTATPTWKERNFVDQPQRPPSSSPITPTPILVSERSALGFAPSLSNSSPPNTLPAEVKRYPPLTLSAPPVSRKQRGVGRCSALQRLARRPLQKCDHLNVGPPLLSSSAFIERIYLRAAHEPGLTESQQATREPTFARLDDSSLVVKLKLSGGPGPIKKRKMMDTRSRNSSSSRAPNALLPSNLRTSRSISALAGPKTDKTPTPSKAATPRSGNRSSPGSVKPLSRVSSTPTRKTYKAPVEKKKIKSSPSGNATEVGEDRSSYLPPAFQIPALSRDCIISYSPQCELGPTDITIRPDKTTPVSSSMTPSVETGRDGANGKKGKRQSMSGAAGKDGSNANKQTGMEHGGYRQIRSERAGEFQESEVLMGVRYVVGV